MSCPDFSCLASSYKGVIHLLPLSVLKCLPRASLLANFLLQPQGLPSFSLPPHTYLFLPVCKSSCLFLSCWRANALPQIEQMNGLSLVCVLRWDFKLYGLVNFFPQTSQAKFAGFFRYSLNCLTSLNRHFSSKGMDYYRYFHHYHHF